MFSSILKALLLSVVVLLLGQIRVGENTIGGHFHDEVKNVCVKGGDRIMQTKFMAGLANTSILSQWVRNVYPPKSPAPEPEENKSPDQPTPLEADSFSTSDRESILRLLQ